MKWYFIVKVKIKLRYGNAAETIAVNMFIKALKFR